jgi:hypothetical protein
MHLVEIFLPLADNDGRRFSNDVYEVIERELSDRFGGVTAYPRAPASGIWKITPTEKQQDDLVVYEVIVTELDRIWWKDYRRKLENVFRQAKLLIRAQAIELL